MSIDPHKQVTIDRIRERLKANEPVLVEILPGDSVWHDWAAGRVVPVKRIEPRRGRVTLHIGPEWYDQTTCPLDSVREVDWSPTYGFYPKGQG